MYGTRAVTVTSPSEKEGQHLASFQQFSYQNRPEKYLLFVKVIFMQICRAISYSMELLILKVTINIFLENIKMEL